MDSFFGIGLPELFFIAVLALIFLGPERLPSTLRQIAKAWGYVRNLGRELTAQFSEEFKSLEDLDPRKILNEMADEEMAKDLGIKQPSKPAKPAAKPAAKTTTNTTSAKTAQPAAKSATKSDTTKPNGDATSPAVKQTPSGQTADKSTVNADEQPKTEPPAQKSDSIPMPQGEGDNAEQTILPPRSVEAKPADPKPKGDAPDAASGREENAAPTERESVAGPAVVSVNGASDTGEHGG